MGEQRLASAQRRREVADQVGHRRRQTLGVAPPRAAVVHPGTAALVLAGVGIEEEESDLGPILLAETIGGDVLVPCRQARYRFRMHAVERAHELEQAIDDCVEGEIALELRIRQPQALFA